MKSEGVKTVVVGDPGGKMVKTIKVFCEKLRQKINIPVVLWDETLSTKDAQARSIEAGIKRSKRKKLEDAFAATIMLQSYLDTHP